MVDDDPTVFPISFDVCKESFSVWHIKTRKKGKKDIFFLVQRKFLKYNCNVGTHISALLSHWDQLAIRLGRSTSTRPLGEAVTFSWMVLGGCKNSEEKTLRNTLSHAMAIVFEKSLKMSHFLLSILILLFSLRICVRLKFVGFLPRANFWTTF